ncbi:helix-turn-helix domain-containing protein [Paenibacillus macerans]|uniref:helix-turn-helix domain-containing protein n=1 Tax=Paenibacillus macerans TaxID=44252 RepID=UPI00203FB74E|nr:helix-turn-helix transcriptional regulator [Paenibacillus macerans]MCM3703209.1 helix-turn-helix transcriptional regulator [Paenibacillus macerans]
MKSEVIFGQVLKTIRKEQKISQESLALRSDLDRTYISMLERGIHQPTLNTLLALANALNIKASELVKIVEDEIEKNE